MIPTLPRLFTLIFLTLASHIKSNLHCLYYPNYSMPGVSPMIPREKKIVYFPSCALFPFLDLSKCFLISPLRGFLRLSSRVSALSAGSGKIFHMSLLYHWSLILHWPTCLLLGTKNILKDKVLASQIFMPLVAKEKNVSPTGTMYKFKKTKQNKQIKEENGGKPGWDQ